MEGSLPLVQALLSWGQEHGTSLAPDVEIYQDPVTGLSFRALQNIPPGTNLVNCSFQTTLSYLNTTELSSAFQSHSPPFPPNFVNSLKGHDPNIVGHFFLIQQYLLGAKSFWWHYIRLLPQPDTPEALGLPVWWPEADLAFLNGTNAEPPIKKRKALWEEEWKRGIHLLGNGFEDCEKYTYHLYRWAASIFGSRSFRASLTIPTELISGSLNSSEDLPLILEHVEKDHFSVLLPLMDVGNHNGINQVDWSRDTAANCFSLSNLEHISQGSQIYNFYGDKSNSELLVAYGFTLPGTERDAVNLRLTPSPDVVQLRRSQASHIVDPTQPEQEFMFNVRIPKDETRHVQGLPQLDMFSTGLVNTMSCMLANNKERRFLLANPTYSLEKDPDVFGSLMSRNIFFVLRILHDKLQYEVSRIEQGGADLGTPKTQNQHTALEYRNRQIQLLRKAIPPISAILQSAFSQSEHDLISLHSHVEFLSLECAFSWLHKHYPDVTGKVSQLISEDQEEPLPLDWAILVEDWDHTYWTVWVYLIWMLWLHNKRDFAVRHVDLAKWISAMNKSYDEMLSSDLDSANFHADSTEQETIDFMVQNISEIGDLVSSPLHQSTTERLRNFASFVASEEVLSASYQMVTGSQAGEILEQKLLCISKVGQAMPVQEEGSWVTFLSSLTT
ncbi:hypothetical protein BKA64DRAFT_693225 [Cadophora sp. MPI-SDFR-AT-0126]|nr:hypothetical protein BKA64DRAFT_693225 [Leotiomycetes sp. MPI-SDFR-AT-0126]